MNHLPLQRAAKELGISPASLRARVADGTGVVRRGSKGRGNATIVDLDVLQALATPGPRSSASSATPTPAGIAAQATLGARATRLPAALIDEIDWIARVDDLTRLGVPREKQRALLQYIERRVLSRVADVLADEGVGAAVRKLQSLRF